MEALKILTEQGAIVEFFSVSTMEYMIPAYYIIASAEASSNLERFDGVKYGYRAADYEGLHDMYYKTRTEGFGEEVKRRIMLGSFVLSSGYYDAYYLKALRAKALIRQEFDRAFEKYDVILAPAAPHTAPRIGESLKDPLCHVSGGYLYGGGKSLRSSGYFRSLRSGQQRSSHRNTDDRKPF